MWVAPQPVHAQRVHIQNIQPGNHQEVRSQIQGPRKVSEPSKPVPRLDVTNIPKSSAKDAETKKVLPEISSKYSGRDYSKEEVKALIIKYSEQYGIPSDIPLCIAYYESGYNQHSKNKSSSASGVFQYLSRTWSGTDEGKAGLSVFDADANVRAAVKYMASRKSTQPWEVRNKCPQLTK
jgi:hypothetical protein